MGWVLETLPTSEILTTLSKASLFGGQVVHPTSSTNIAINIQRIDIDQNGTLTIRLEEWLKAEEKWPVSVKLNYRNVSFLIEPENYSLEGNLLVGQLPKKAKAIPERNSNRYILPMNSQVMTSFHRIEKRGESQDIEASLIDVSEKGLGILMSNPEGGDILKEHDHLWIHSLNNVQLEEPVFAKVVYVYKKKFKDGVDIKAGISLDAPIPEELFLMLQERCKLILKG